MELYPGVDHEQLLGLARRIVGPTEAEDVVQTAYLKAFKRQDTFRAECRPSTWLFQITRRCAIDHLRRRKRRPEEGLPAKELTYEDEPRLLEGLIREAGERMQALPTIHRDVLQAMLLWGSFESAAAALGISIGATKSRLRRARLALRRQK